MILSDQDIKKEIKAGWIKFKPELDFNSQLGSCSVDLRLGNRFRIFNHSRYACIDPQDKSIINDLTELVKLDKGDPFIIQPQDFVLAETIESFQLPDDLLGRLEGRSSLGRLGIVVHSTASIFDPGWRGKAVLELGNHGRMPVALYPGIRICSMTFEQLSSKAQVPYTQKDSAKYIDQAGPVASKIFEEHN